MIPNFFFFGISGLPHMLYYQNNKKQNESPSHEKWVYDPYEKFCLQIETRLLTKQAG